MATHHDSLIAIMVLVSAADNDIADQELKKMADVVRSWPVFSSFDIETLPDSIGNL